MTYALLFIIAYLLGAFPSGYLVARTQGIRIYEHGSGNVGATNVARVLGKRFGLLTLILDVIKGFVAVWIIYLFTQDISLLALGAVCVVMGHCISLPPFLKGGKGVASALGVYAYTLPWVTIVAIILFLLSFRILRRVSVASLIANISIPIGAYFVNVPKPLFFASCAIALLIVYSHRTNLKRIFQGEEQQLVFASDKNQS